MEGLYTKPDVMNVKGKKILCVGRLTILKGYHFLFECIKNDLNQFDWHIFFVGERHLATANDEAVFQNIQAEIVRLRLSERVHFIPFTKDVASYMKYCDVLVHPTQFEGFGLVLVEAMRLRVPIITTNVEAIPEILNGTGITQLNYSDTDELRNAICKCLNEFSKEDEAVIEKAFVRSLQFTLNNRVNFFLEMIKQ
jgi:glycosyltransferase involved in cell wall biosynthesis